MLRQKKSRKDIQEGDYVKFKGNRNREDKNKKEDFYYGIVSDTSKEDFIGLKVDKNDKRMDYPLGLTIYIDKKMIYQIYPSKIFPYLTPRLALKHLWKDLIFREVKITKCSNLLYAEYRYINKSGFERMKRFKTMEEAKENISSEYHKNIIPCYADFFGFTLDKPLRNNDYHYDREIFFSKKCYAELNWSSKPTGDFLTDEIGYNNEPPAEEALVCGIVEHGEKGLYFRKWFLASNEFLTLWTMVCDSNDISLYDNKVDVFTNKTISKKIKTFSQLLRELDTSHYAIDLNLDLKERRKTHTIYNMERAAMYYSTRYIEIAEILFSKGFLKSEDEKTENEKEKGKEDKIGVSYSDDIDLEYSPFQKKLIRNILWMKNVV